MAEKRRKVLIVDDEADVRAFVQAALEDEGYEFITGTTGGEALEKAETETPDLVIMDIQMPKKNGFAALYDLRQNPALKDIPVILLTGIAEKTGVRFSADTVKEYMGEKPDAYLDKPVDPEKLRESARKLLGT